MEVWRSYVRKVTTLVNEMLAGRNGSFCELLDGTLTVYFRGPDGATKTATLSESNSQVRYMFTPERMAEAIFRRGLEFMTRREKQWRIQQYNERRRRDGIQ